jgi:hypothetical protein
VKYIELKIKIKAFIKIKIFLSHKFGTPDFSFIFAAALTDAKLLLAR